MEQGTFRVSKTQPCFHPKQHFLWLAAFSVEIFPVAHLPGFIIFSPYLCSRRTVLKMCFCSCFLLVFNSGCKTTIFSWFYCYAKNSSSRNQKRVVRGALLCPILPIRLTKFNWLQRPSRGLRIRNLTISLFLPNLLSA